MKQLKSFLCGIIIASIGIPTVSAAVEQFILTKADYYVVINGITYNDPESPLLNYNGKTYVPLRSMLEASGMHVDFVNNTAYVSNKVTTSNTSTIGKPSTPNTYSPSTSNSVLGEDYFASMKELEQSLAELDNIDWDAVYDMPETTYTSVSPTISNDSSQVANPSVTNNSIENSTSNPSNDYIENSTSNPSNDYIKYQTIINQKKEQLLSEKSPYYYSNISENYEQGLENRTRAVTNIQDRLAEIANNNSSSTQNERIHLQNELNEKQKKLDDFVNDNNINSMIKSLDSELERY